MEASPDLYEKVEPKRKRTRKPKVIEVKDEVIVDSTATNDELPEDFKLLIPAEETVVVTEEPKEEATPKKRRRKKS